MMRAWATSVVEAIREVVRAARLFQRSHRQPSHISVLRDVIAACLMRGRTCLENFSQHRPAMEKQNVIASARNGHASPS
jgi:hypothetical protein